MFNRFKDFIFYLLIFYSGVATGCAGGFYFYSLKFPQKVVTLEKVKIKSSPGARSDVTILEDQRTDTVRNSKNVFRHLFGRKKKRAK